MKWIWITAGVIALLVVAVLLVGWLLPEKHRAERQATLNAPPQAVWDLMTNVEAFPSWRSDVKTVKRLNRNYGGTAQVVHYQVVMTFVIGLFGALVLVMLLVGWLS